MSQQDPQNVLDELLAEMHDDIRDSIHHNYLQMFEELNEKLNADDTEMVNNYILNLEEIKKEIHSLIENAIEK